MVTTVAWLGVAVTLALAGGFVLGRLSAAAGFAARTAAGHAMVLRDELRAAPGRDEFVLHYQPKVDLRTGRVTTLEALVRWQHPRRGLLMPAEFLPVAGQHSDLMAAMTGWVLRRALTDLMAWTATGNDWTVSVNIFAKNLGSLDFPATVAQILHQAGVEPSRLRLEVNQTELAVDTERVAQVVAALVAQGVMVSIDDFGSAHTDTGWLRTLQVSELKIDPSLVIPLPGHEPDRAKVRSLIDLGHSLGCSVTAEAVEWPDVADWLLSAGCDHAQGYLWLRPRAWNEVAQVFGKEAESPDLSAS